MVRAIEGDALVVAVAVEACSGCGKRSGCGIGRLAGGARQSLVRIPAPDGPGAPGAIRVGDDVLLTVASDAIHRAALLTYLLPALLLAVGAIAGDTLFSNWVDRDSGSAVGALVGLVAGLAFAGWTSGRHGGTRIAVRRADRPAAWPAG